MTQPLIIKYLGEKPYLTVQQAMQAFTQQRGPDTVDELWLLQHPPVFTQGQAGKPEHVLNPGDIPVVQSDRGGQVTYHGPGQLIAYTLFDLQRLDIGIRTLVRKLENAVITVLAHYDLEANGKVAAPGVYVNEAKICSLGLRVKRHCSYHGLAFNIDMDLTPFQRINPCGFKHLKVTQLRDFVPKINSSQVTQQLIAAVCQQFKFNDAVMSDIQLTSMV